MLLKKLDQGVLLVTGPFKANGVPLRRVNARYVIVTDTKVSLAGLDQKVLEKASDKKYFARDRKNEKKGEDAFFKQGDAPAVSPAVLERLYWSDILIEEGAFQRTRRRPKDHRQSSPHKCQEDPSPPHLPQDELVSAKWSTTTRDDLLDASHYDTMRRSKAACIRARVLTIAQATMS